MADGTYRLTAHLHNAKGYFWENVFNYAVVGSPVDDSKFATALALADAWVAKIGAAFLHCMGADTLLDVVTARCIDPLPGSTASSIVGSNSDQVNAGMTAGAAADIVWIDGGDTGRFSRTFLANPPEGMLEGDSFVAAYITAVDAWALLMTAELSLGAGVGNGSFVHYVEKTKTVHAIVVGDVRDKASMLNKRTIN